MHARDEERMIVRETHDLLRLWAYAASLIHAHVNLGGPEACEFGCLMCDTCSEAYEWMSSMFEEAVVYSVRDSGREVGFVYNFGSTTYSFLY